MAKPTVPVIPRSQAEGLHAYRYELQQQRSTGTWSTVLATHDRDTAVRHGDYLLTINRDNQYRVIDNDK